MRLASSHIPGSGKYKIQVSFLWRWICSSKKLFQMQFIRFLRRTEGVEAARKYFIDARKSPTCTYHVYVAYAKMAFCLDKDPKVYSNFSSTMQFAAFVVITKSRTMCPVALLL